MPQKNTEVGNRIKSIRDRLGLTQMEFGKILGLCTAAINNYEKGRIPAGWILIKIAGIGKVSLDWLLTGKESGEKEEAIMPYWFQRLDPEHQEVVIKLSSSPTSLKVLAKMFKSKKKAQQLLEALQSLDDRQIEGLIALTH